MGYYAKLCLVTAYQSGTPVDDGYNYSYGEEGGDENAEMDEIHDESLDIENWLDNEYPLALSHIHFDIQMINHLVLSQWMRVNQLERIYRVYGNYWA